MTRIASTTNNNNVSTHTACNNGHTTTIFSVHQQTLFKLSEILIHTLVSDAISAEFYRKAFSTKKFYRQILPLSVNPSVSFSDLITTAASYFDINTGSTERKVESAA